MFTSVKKFFASFFEGAKPTEYSRSSFSNAGKKPFYELVTNFDLQNLRSRARYLSANNALMSSIDEGIINNALRNFQVKFDDVEIQKLWNAFVKKADYTRQLDLYALITLLEKQRMIDGEVFVYKRYTKEGLKLHAFEADVLDTAKGTQGVNISGEGEVLGYWVVSNQYIAKEHILHHFKKERITQYRGVTDYAAAIFDIKNMTAFITASIESMVTKASQTYAIKTDGGNAGVVSQDFDDEYRVINGISAYVLKPNESIDLIEGSTTPINYKEFLQETAVNLCLSRKVSYQFGTRDVRDANFTSIRAGRIEDRKTFEAIKKYNYDGLIYPIMEAFFEFAYLRGEVKTKEVPEHSLVYPIQEWVKPLEDLEYNLTLVDRNVKTMDSVCREISGRGYAEILQQRKEERELEKSILGEHKNVEN